MRTALMSTLALVVVLPRNLRAQELHRCGRTSTRSRGHRQPLQPHHRPAAPAAAQPGLGASLGLYVFPAKSQTPEQQAQDEQACYAWSKEQSGIDPATVKANPDSAMKAASAKVDTAAQGAAIKGAARGAAGGAVVGAIAGDAGTGAGVGAVVGAASGQKGQEAGQEAGGNAGGTASQRLGRGADRHVQEGDDRVPRGQGLHGEVRAVDEAAVDTGQYRRTAAVTTALKRLSGAEEHAVGSFDPDSEVDTDVGVGVLVELDAESDAAAGIRRL